jgi:hypothetical protein
MLSPSQKVVKVGKMGKWCRPEGGLGAGLGGGHLPLSVGRRMEWQRNIEPI